MEDISDIGTPDATISSVNTSLSGLTGYEEEFNDLRLLTHSTSPNHQFRLSPLENNDLKLLYETKIKSLTLQLDNALKSNEKLKSDLDLKEAESRKRVNTLITKTAHLEAQLAAVCCHIQGLLKQCCSDETLNTEQNCLNVCEQIRIIQNEIIRCNSEKNTKEILISNIRRELEMAKEEVQTRISCVNELKKKVSEQYTGIENVSQYNKTLENKLRSVESEIDWYKKSENWYKEQLNNERAKYMTTSQDVIKLQQQLFIKDQEINKLTLKIKECRCEYEELQALQKKEKQEFLRKIEKLQFEAINKIPSITETKGQSICCNCKEMEISIQNIRDEMNVTKINAHNQIKFFEEIKTEKNNLDTKIMLLEKSVNEKELIIQHLKQHKVDVQNELSAKQMLIQSKSQELQNLREINNNLSIKLSALTQEKVEVENTINLIRRDLNKFVIEYRQLKNDVSEKNNIISDLKTQIQAFSNTSQTEDITKSNKELEITELKSTISVLESTILELQNKCEIFALEKEKFAEIVQNYLPEIEQKNKELLEEKHLKLCASEECNSKLKISLEEKEDIIQSLTTEVNDLKMEKAILQKTSPQRHVINDICFSNSEFSEVKCNEQNEELIIKILELISDRLVKMEKDVLCKEDINIEMKMLNAESKPFLLLQKIMHKLLAVDARMKKTWESGSNNSILSVISNFSDSLINKTQSIIDKCNMLQQKAERCYLNLNIFKQNLDPSEEIIKLKAQLMELEEKLKRYEINNRTLLRKVKEHMKARNAAEKQHLHLQTLHNSLNDAYNVLEVEINNKNIEIQQSDMLVSNLREYIANQQTSFFNVERQMVEQNDILKNSLEEKENRLLHLNKLLEEKNTECDKSKSLLIEDERQIMQLKDLNAELSETVKKSQEKLKSMEKECLDLRVQLKSSECNLLEYQNKFENQTQLLKCRPTYGLLQNNNIVNKLQLEVERLNNERWFLQRLCNDLKCALQASVNEKQVLKVQSTKSLCSLLEMTKKISVPNSCDDVLIKTLLERSKASQVTLNIIERPLHILKSELTDLQECVKKRNFVPKM